jgi:hypothetical protein
LQCFLTTIADQLKLASGYQFKQQLPPVAISVALSDHPCLYKGAAAYHADGVCIVLAKVEVPAEPKLDVCIPFHKPHEPLWSVAVV